MKGIIMKNHLLWIVFLTWYSISAPQERDRCFIIGADISGSHSLVESGRTFEDNGEDKTLLAILKEHGFNWIRLRMFVDPTVKVPEVPNESPYSMSGACDLEHTVDFAKYIKEAGFKFLLDFHYSDTWADPGKQYKPVSWRDLSYEELVEQVRTYTRESLEAFEDAGVLPEMVQVGNEIVGGMIWPDGRSSNMSQFAELVNAGIDGVKDVSEDIEIMIHSISERSPSGWLSALISAGVERIDVFGLSYYAQWHGTPDDLEQRVGDVADNHDVYIALAEYSDNHRRVNDIIFDLPDGKGLGTFIWEPTGWGEALFNRGATNERMDYYPEMVKAYGNDTCSEENTPLVFHNPVVARKPANRTVWFDETGRLHLMYHQPVSSVREKRLFTLQGKLAGSLKNGPADKTALSLPRGVYIVKTVDNTANTLVKTSGAHP